MRRQGTWDGMGSRGGRVELLWCARGMDSRVWLVHEAGLIVANTSWRVGTWRAMCHVAEKRGSMEGKRRNGDEGKGKRGDEGKGKRRKEGHGNGGEEGKGKSGNKGKGKTGDEDRGKRGGEGNGRSGVEGNGKKGDGEKGKRRDGRKGLGEQEQAGGGGDGRKGSVGGVGAEGEGADETRLHSRWRKRGRPRKVVSERGAAVPSVGAGNEADGRGGSSNGGVREQQQQEMGGGAPSHGGGADVEELHHAISTARSQHDDLYSTHLAHMAPPFASHRATRDNAMTLLALQPPPDTLAAIFHACSSLFLVPLTHRIRAALEIFSAHGLPESLFLSVIRRVPELILNAQLDDVSSNGSSSKTSSNKSSETHEQEQTSNSHSEHHQQQDALTPLSDSHDSPSSTPPSHLTPTDLPHLQQVLHFLFLHLPPPTVAKLLHSAACRVFRTPLPSLLLHLSAMQSILAPPHSLLFRYPLALRFSPEILKQRLSRLAEIVPLTGAQVGVGGENGSGGGDGEGRARRKIGLDSASFLPIPPLDPSLSFTADPAVLSLVHRQPHILHASKLTM
ncbi:unnamed protein product [Closterium sp. NIES-64]|nr:unnamed protein product [Closterium sp. NIES-64]